jgi:hypothetical protein
MKLTLAAVEDEKDWLLQWELTSIGLIKVASP